MTTYQDDELRIDDTGFQGIKVIQKPGLGYGVDAVLLAAFAAGETGAKPVPEGAAIADLGSGSGIVAMLMAHKSGASNVMGFDFREGSIERATESSRISGLQDNVSFVRADVADKEAFDKYRSEFDAVVTNPPYFKKDSAIPSETSDKFVARHETTASLGDWCQAAAGMLRQGGSLYMVHRPDRLVDIMTEMRNAGLEPKELQLVTPKQGARANIVLVHGIKGAGPELKMLEEIAIHEGDGYTDIINKIYEREVHE